MNDESASGNRWEPRPGQPADPAETAPVGRVQPADGESVVTPAPVDGPADDVGTTREPRAGVRRHLTAARAKIAAAAAAVFVVGGAGGFALAHAVSDDQPASFTPGQRPGDGPGERPGDGHRDLGGPHGVPPGNAPRQDSQDDDSGRSFSGTGTGDDT